MFLGLINYLGCAVSGSQALSVALGSSLYDDGDLDIFIKGGRVPESLEKTLLQSGYKGIDESEVYTFKVFSFFNEKIQKKIQIVMTLWKSPTEFIRESFYSLHLMNWYHSGSFIMTSSFGLENRVIEPFGEFYPGSSLSSMKSTSDL
ncbi:hypothetical protein BGZ76_006389, partial [Entomortierella beljakovae]